MGLEVRDSPCSTFRSKPRRAFGEATATSPASKDTGMPFDDTGFGRNRSPDCNPEILRS